VIAGQLEPRRLSEVAVYHRVVGAAIERVWENVLDWEHLPWLHASSFARVELLASRRDGWRARVWLQPAERERESVVETHLDFARRRYLTLTSHGVGAGTEIWTSLQPRGAAATAIEVRFLVADVPAEHHAKVGEAYRRLYAKLWDEDEAMMRRRQALLACRRRRAAAVQTLSLGPLDELRRRLPLDIEYGGRPFRIVEVEGKLIAHATICPHLLGPLDALPVEDGCVRCPWHGYRFALASGRCLEVPKLALAKAPTLSVHAQTGIVTARRR